MGQVSGGQNGNGEGRKVTRRDAMELVTTCAAFWVVALGVQMIQTGLGW